MAQRQRRVATLLAAIVAWCSSTGAGAADLAPTGVLRAAFLGSNPVQGVVDPVSGQVTGPAAELTAALAARLGRTWTVTPVANPPALIEAIKTGATDIGFLAFDPARAAEVAFSQPYSLAFNGYLVPASASIASAADIDRPGVRVGVGARDAADLYLSRTLKQAELRRNTASSIESAIRMVAAHEVDVYAANRHRLSLALPQLPGARVLAENFLAVEQAIVVKPGDPERLAMVDRFLDEARASGLISAALARARLVGVEVAPIKPR